ncbi:hypothetical protein GCL60_07990 [Silvanigrella paludirubra]|uniref:Uncharacterized protein n=1 Tax=Silvanigrella paludirubra TaxID=2499159 RepID=A0A6N6VU80_9BACT|nr:hypothetical protein [Silvanigrella paludirubra]KAB8038794.1 hypothetical protein GCL60_07990 [Silvanigrella paludirubra]
MKIKFIYLILFIINTFCFQSIFAETTEVFCATNDKKWEWLRSNNQIVSVNGEWVLFSKSITNNRYLSLRYFKIDADWSFIENLQKECIKKFGPSYIFAQVADSMFSDWFLLGVSNNSVAKGVFELNNRCVFCSRNLKPFSIIRINFYDYFNLEKYFNEF